MAKVGITETILRDAHQSLIATRMTTEEMLPALEQLDDIGYHSLECWGGATFDSCLRFLDEDPWERLRILRRHMPKTKLQMLFRGQNVLGYRHYADDMVEYFVQKSVANGIDIIRISMRSTISATWKPPSMPPERKRALTFRWRFPIPPDRYTTLNTMSITPRR